MKKMRICVANVNRSCTLCTVVILFLSAYFVLGMTMKMSTEKKVYRYFGFGSNNLPSTMKALRQIDVRPDCVTAAILPNYQLKFYNDAAFVRQTTTTTTTSTADENENENVVHGVLYTLTDDEFSKVGQTEGVPFGYRWQSCLVYPYKGDGKQAGNNCLSMSMSMSMSMSSSNNDNEENNNNTNTLVSSSPPVKAYTLVEARQRKETSPSPSYLGLIQEGARLWKFDSSYQEQLASIETKGNGISGILLQVAEKATGTKRTYMIDGYEDD
jgi:hypothetical protein